MVLIFTFVAQLIKVITHKNIEQEKQKTFEYDESLFTYKIYQFKLLNDLYFSCCNRENLKKRVLDRNKS